MASSRTALALLLSCALSACAADATPTPTEDTQVTAPPADAGPDDEVAAPDSGPADTGSPTPDVTDTTAEPDSAAVDAAPACSPACGDHGTCEAGACACEAGFAGPTCDDCEAEHFGPTCAPCACGHGYCASGLTGDGACVCESGYAGAACDEETEPAIPWSEGPYGEGIRETAADLTVKTEGGDWKLSEQWTGHDSYVFVFRYAASTYDTDVWGDDLATLIDASPRSVHYLFGSLDGTWEQDMEQMSARIDEALATLPAGEQRYWRAHLHVITEPAGALPFVKSMGTIWFAIDRFQRWREIGSLYDFVTDGTPIDFLANEPRTYDYEARLRATMDELAAKEVVLLDHGTHEGGWGGGYSTAIDAVFPAAAEMATYDSMAVYLYTACPNHLQGKDAGCNEWDYIQDLTICDIAKDGTDTVDEPCNEGDTLPCECARPDGTIAPASRTCNAEGTGYGACNCGCDTELVRWVTSYGREGEWLTDVSPLLFLVKGGGTIPLRFGGANAYTVDARVLLWNAGKGYRPTSGQYLWGKRGGEAFNQDYNDGKHADVVVTPPDGTIHTELVATISGHGHSSTTENCAEFCNHQHKFAINGKTYTKEHPLSGTPYGCMQQVDDGVVPNQFGTWMLGRGGWCPGLDVKPWVVDISDDLTSGPTPISYKGLFYNKNYKPTVKDPGGYLPEIKMTSWLVYYEAMQ